MNTPQIKIFGTTASGKTALSMLIKETLETHGIVVSIVGEDEEQELVNQTWKERIQCLSEKQVEIKMVRTLRESLQLENCNGRYEISQELKRQFLELVDICNKFGAGSSMSHPRYTRQVTAANKFLKNINVENSLK